MNWKRGVVIVLLLSLVWLWQQWPDGKLRVVFCDVGQGDASLVVWGSFQALIDTGPSERKLFACLAKEIPFWDRQIDLVFISHPQADHDGALKGLRARYKIGKVVEKAGNNDRYRYKDLYFDILLGGQTDNGEEKVSGSDENEDSMVVSLRYFGFSALFTADIGEKTELALLDTGVLKKTSILKVPHHGSKFSSSISFLERLSPKLAIISVGAGNSYGHPSGDTLMRLDQVNAKVLRTDLQGNVGVIYDAGEIQVFTER
ncbi:MAG: MBL fold metallo-hydrolase [Microgenomates group bacterium]